MTGKENIAEKLDLDLINAEDPHEVLEWSNVLHVTEEELRKAISKVGNRLEDVKRELGR